MAKLKIRGKHLLKLGYPDEGKVIGLAINMAKKHCKRQSLEEVLGQLKAVLEQPEAFKEHPHFAMVAEELIEEEAIERQQEKLHDQPVTYPAFGLRGIEKKTVDQMDIAMRLPITQAGALMPDAHLGYGLPIGGVLATKNAVIPYGVGMDIGLSLIHI